MVTKLFFFFLSKDESVIKKYNTSFVIADSFEREDSSNHISSSFTLIKMKLTKITSSHISLQNTWLTITHAGKEKKKKK